MLYDETMKMDDWLDQLSVGDLVLVRRTWFDRGLPGGLLHISVVERNQTQNVVIANFAGAFAKPGGSANFNTRLVVPTPELLTKALLPEHVNESRRIMNAHIQD